MTSSIVNSGLRSIPTRVGISRWHRLRCQAASVHPHARGDLYPDDPPNLRSYGPSPRAWGSRSHEVAALQSVRSIPTRVGISRGWRPSRQSPSDHPHARGDLATTALGTWMPHGPSPRAWGSHCMSQPARRRGRSIPTRVGISRTSTRAAGCRPVHPHARGDLNLVGDVELAGHGPSPRAWGSLPMSLPNPTHIRSIPTRVGISLRSWGSLTCPPVHPHARGDLFFAGGSKAPVSGPSPRAWGSRCRLRGPPHVSRSIPTRVGISDSRSGPTPPATVHPHARGDLTAWSSRSRRCRGPSPRAWGSRSTPAIEAPASRSIPTRVGISCLGASLPSLPAVHPHARGDLDSPTLPVVSMSGPSPRAWGSRVERGRVGHRDRSIPTRVGISRGTRRRRRGRPVHPHARGDLT